MSDQGLSPAEAQKRAAGRRAAEEVRSGQVVGLGTGSTVRYALEALGERARQGLAVLGVPTSSQTEAIARRLGIPLTDLAAHPAPDLAIDGADEIDPRLNLIKGLGGALVREKLVETSARKLIVVADESKLVPVLGAKTPVPVAVVPFGWTTTRDRLAALGCRPVPRAGPGGEPLATDDGLFVLDCWFGPIADPPALARALKATLGVVDSGLFVGLPAAAMVARADLSIEVL